MSIMRILKDIKISRDRIPVQNALWIRPMGNLSFKLYIPAGTDWREVSINNAPEPTPTPTPAKVKRNNCEGGKVIIGRCIPMYPTVGDRYYFADGVVKFKRNPVPGQKTNRVILWDCSSGGSDRFVTCSPTRKNLVQNTKRRHCPVIAVIEKGGFCEPDKVRVIKGDCPKTLSCDTTSPHFKVVDGYVRHMRQFVCKDITITSDDIGQRNRVKSHDVRRGLLRSKWIVWNFTTRRTSHNRPGRPATKRQVKRIEGSWIINERRTIKKILYLKYVKRSRASNIIKATLLSKGPIPVASGSIPNKGMLKVTTKHPRV